MEQQFPQISVYGMANLAIDTRPGVPGGSQVPGNALQPASIVWAFSWSERMVAIDDGSTRGLPVPSVDSEIVRVTERRSDLPFLSGPPERRG